MSPPISLRRDGCVLHVTLNRPKRRNAMNSPMVRALTDTFADLESDDAIRVVVLRGAGGHFCSGGDVSDMARASAPEQMASMNRSFGTMLQHITRSRTAVVALCEGAVMGGGLGLACVADVTIAVEGTRFRLPETGLGITPAQIAPFVVQRIGLSRARWLAVTGMAIGAAEATALHLAHHHAETLPGAEEIVVRILEAIRRCEPGALAATKRLMLAANDRGPTEDLLDAAAEEFASLATGPAARAGFAAFTRREAPPWSQERG